MKITRLNREKILREKNLSKPTWTYMKSNNWFCYTWQQKLQSNILNNWQ